jgi:hypothetical protein
MIAIFILTLAIGLSLQLHCDTQLFNNKTTKLEFKGN